jgi:AAA ATPase domain
MPMVPHPEVLSPEFVPPTLFGRERELAKLRQMLASDGSRAGSRCALVRGPAGSGTSAVVRLAARRVVEEARGTYGGAAPVYVALRAPAHRGTHGLAAALLRQLDEGFEPKGFHTMEMLAGFLRRLNRQGRSAVVVVDDVGPAGPDLIPFYRAFSRPDRFLPEGDDLRISTWFLLGGRTEAARVWTQAARWGIAGDRRIDLAPYSRAELDALVRDRAQRALGHPPIASVLARVGDRAFADGASAVRGLQLLRRELLGPELRARPLAPATPGSRSLLEIEPHLLDALETSLGDHPSELGALRTEEGRCARVAGRRPLPSTTLWRRLLRLESAGLVRRRVRTGGPGGTRSTLELIRPISEWPVRPGRYDIPLGSFASPAPSRGPAPSSEP